VCSAESYRPCGRAVSERRFVSGGWRIIKETVEEVNNVKAAGYATDPLFGPVSESCSARL